MTKPTLHSRLAVCSWSLKPQTPAQLINDLEEIGIQRVQIALDPIRTDSDGWASVAEDCARRGVTFVSGMFGTVGEDYSTLETIRRTGGVVPDETWEQNWTNIQADLKIARRLGLKLVTFHAGFLPHDPDDPAFAKILDRITRVADLFAQARLNLAFETGQEDASTLAYFLRVLNRPNVGVNFDPANMILYDKGDPIEALRLLAPSVFQCHIKDGTKTKVPGTWGREVVVGKGDVNWSDFLATLESMNFRGDLCIEREADNQRVEDIRAARIHLEGLL